MHSITGCLINNKLEKMWKEKIINSFAWDG